MKVTVKPSRACGTVAAPPSKSYAHRLLIAGALADGTSRITGVAPSQDMLATLDCLAALGVPNRLENGVAVLGGGSLSYPDGRVFPCRESGSTLRFFLPIARVRPGLAVFTGSERLIERGVGVYETLLSEKGVSFEKAPDRVTVSGCLTPGTYTLPGNVSSQFVSGLLFALPLLEGDSRICVLPPVESRPYIDMTVEVISRFGIRIERIDPNTFSVPGGQTYRPGDQTVEGDWSNAAALFAYNLAGGDVTVTGLNPDSLQGDRVCLAALEALKEPNPAIDLSDCPDLGPILFAAAALRGGATFTGTKRLRIKESDRAAVMAEELAKFGVSAVVEENAVRILPGALRRPTAPLNSHNDHRIVMAMTLLASVTGGSIIGAEAIHKSYPAFFDTLAALGLEVTCDA